MSRVKKQAEFLEAGKHVLKQTDLENAIGGNSLKILAEQAELQSNRKQRRLFIGNLQWQQGLSEDEFSTIFFDAMREREYIDLDATNPINTVVFARDRNLACGFIELNSVENAQHGLKLHGMEVFGKELNIRPIYESGMPDPLDPAPVMQSNAIPAPIPGSGVGINHAFGQNSAPLLPSRIIRFVQALLWDGSQKDDDFEDVIEDMQQACESFGPVEMVMIIKPSNLTALKMYTCGDVWVEFKEKIHAKQCIVGMAQRRYDGRILGMEQFNEATWYNAIKKMIKKEQ